MDVILVLAGFLIFVFVVSRICRQSFLRILSLLSLVFCGMSVIGTIAMGIMAATADSARDARLLTGIAVKGIVACVFYAGTGFGSLWAHRRMTKFEATLASPDSVPDRKVLRLRCPSCNAEMSVREERIGYFDKCGECGTSFRVEESMLLQKKKRKKSTRRRTGPSAGW